MPAEKKIAPIKKINAVKSINPDDGWTDGLKAKEKEGENERKRKKSSAKRN